MLTVDTSNGKRWYWHATEKDFLKAVHTRRFIGVSVTDEGQITWQIATAHIVAYQVMAE